MTRFFSKLTRQLNGNRSKVSTGRRQVRLAVEALEERAVATVSPALTPAQVNTLFGPSSTATAQAWTRYDSGTKTLWIFGSNQDDNVKITETDTTTQSTAHVNVNGVEMETLDMNAIRHIYFCGYAGNDTFINNAIEPLTDVIAFGREGADKLWNPAQPVQAYLDGGAGNDYLEGGAIMHGGDGDDTLVGDHDPLSGDRGGQFFGENGNDTLIANDGGCTLDGGYGNDVLRGGAGNDNLIGGVGNDALYGFGGIDTLNGGAGNDFLDGGADGCKDVLMGGAGADRFKAEWTAGTLKMINRDAPQDFSAIQGDSIVNPWLVHSPNVGTMQTLNSQLTPAKVSVLGNGIDIDGLRPAVLDTLFAQTTPTLLA